METTFANLDSGLKVSNTHLPALSWNSILMLWHSWFWLNNTVILNDSIHCYLDLCFRKWPIYLNRSDSNVIVSAFTYCWKSIVLALTLQFQKSNGGSVWLLIFRRNCTTLAFILCLSWYVFVRLCSTQYNKVQDRRSTDLLENKAHMRSKSTWDFSETLLMEMIKVERNDGKQVAQDSSPD